MFVNLKEFIILKEKLKNTYAYQNSKKLKTEEKGKRFIERTEDDLVYDLVKSMENFIDKQIKNSSRLNDIIKISFEKERLEEIDIPDI